MSNLLSHHVSSASRPQPTLAPNTTFSLSPNLNPLPDPKPLSQALPKTQNLFFFKALVTAWVRSLEAKRGSGGGGVGGGGGGAGGFTEFLTPFSSLPELRLTRKGLKEHYNLLTNLTK